MSSKPEFVSDGYEVLVRTPAGSIATKYDGDEEFTFDLRVEQGSTVHFCTISEETAGLMALVLAGKYPEDYPK